MPTFPSDDLARVTGLVHRYSPGNYTLEILLGDTKTDWASIRPSIAKEPAPTVPEKPLEEVAPVPEELLPTPTPTAPTPTLADFIQWLSLRTEEQIIAIFGHYPITFAEWLERIMEERSA